MSNIRWKTGISGTFNTAADWSGGQVPGAGDVAVINAKPVSGNYTVTVSNLAATLGALTLNQQAASLLLNECTINVTGAVNVLAGTLDVGAGGNLNGNINLSGGTLALDGGQINGTLTAGKGNVSVKGISSLNGLTVAGNLTFDGSNGSTLQVSGEFSLLCRNTSSIGTISVNNCSLQLRVCPISL